MTTPQVTRPHFPKGYVDHPKSLLPWEDVESRLTDAVHYWLSSVRPNNRPHAVPLWAVWVNGRIYYDGSPETQHGKNIARNPFVTVHLESGEKVVIVEGTAKAVTPSRDLASRIAKSYAAKYASRGYSPEPTSWDAGGLYEIQPRTVIAWNSFTDDPTKFIFPIDPD